jgi:hypothetical protein
MMADTPFVMRLYRLADATNTMIKTPTNIIIDAIRRGGCVATANDAVIIASVTAKSGRTYLKVIATACTSRRVIRPKRRN